MKKSSIALGVAALMAAGVHAAIVQGNATQIVVNPNGIGHKLIFPYYTVQGNNATLINIVNHDQLNGKAVKVRFRGAANSDDVYDFTLLMSPGDVWVAAVTQGADGRAQLFTPDSSCTLPANVNGSFITGRLDPNSTVSLEEQTREGYVEIINMADIPKNTASTSLWTAIKHGSNGKPTNCNAAVVTQLSGDAVANINSVDGSGQMTSYGLSFPSTGLSGDWIIINQQTTAAWSGSATALEARNGGAATTANFVFFPQSGSGVSSTTASNWSADPLFEKGVVGAAYYDFPDLSTAYLTSTALSVSNLNSYAAAASYRNLVAAALAKTVVANEFVTDSTIDAKTDLVFSQPVRRYYAAVNYGSTATAVYATSSGVYTSNNTALSNRVLCVRRPTGSSLLSFTAYDREEATLSPSGAVISPGTPTRFDICGEVAVTSINGQGGAADPSALNGKLARNDINLGSLIDGWIEFNTALDTGDRVPGVTGLPIIGNAHLRARNGSVNYGFTWPHKYNYSNK
ncbi:hypothetical protein Talka_01092 [Tepidimonas alkaliphilus]|uniref:Cell surface protein n=1 Tax=Tepidimonas alkaliphilus TaxID=2588942 RepID=A0A554W9E7_9BURK|nr:hypothetical protein [Tepidimonas alkaliphilus]TSE20197.1 hypothetical protein Talka_01092 [Tepidimonas alkaliphilus]